MQKKLLFNKVIDYFDFKKRTGLLHSTFLILSLFCFSDSLFSQTTLINPATDGGFNSGSTFAANGWTVANEGTGTIKWAVGTAASGTTSVGATTASSTTVTLNAANANIAIGQIVFGAGIPANTFVQNIVGTTLTLSQNASVSAASTTLGFGKYSGGISVGAVELTTASIAANTYSVTLAAANPNISVGMAIAPVSGFIGADTYVASISGTTLGLSKASLNNSALAVAQGLTFTATSAAISGNAAYITNDNGTSYSFGGYPSNRTVYFYRDINVPSAEKAMTLTFDVKSDPASSAGWQVWVAPISQTVTGTNTQVTTSGAYGVSWPGATLISFNSNPQVAATKTTAFIPKSFAGVPFRLIFVWTNSSSAGVLPPAAIDNISLTSRIPEEITCAHSGLWSQAGTWDGGKVPTPADTAVLDNDDETVLIDSRYSGCEDLILAGANTLVQYVISSIMDEFTVNNDINLAASGARFNNHDGTTNSKYLKVGHNIDVGAGARFDSSLGGTTNFQGRLTLNGTSLQTVTVDPAGFMGGSAPGTNAFGNRAGVLNQLEVTNTSSATPNVIWNVNGVRISSALLLTSGRVSIASGKRIILGNFGALSAVTCPSGNGFTNGTVSKWTNSGNTKIVQTGTEYPGMDNNYKTSWYPFVSGAGLDRSLYLMPDASPATIGEVAVTYTDAVSVTNGLSIADGSYTINKRYNGSWAFSTPESSSNASSIVYAPNATTPTNRIGVYANGAFGTIDGSSRLMNSAAALIGTHQDGTTLPFVFRKDLPFATLAAAPVYVGVSDASVINAATSITSAASGDWNTPSTWVGSVVPSCTSIVTIAAGHNITVTNTADAASVVITKGASLTNNAGATTMTVGCSNNNAAFYNYGTHTMTAGNLKVNGFVIHKTGSFFNQTGGDIIIDSNNNGDAATSVALGGTSCKIETANLNLTGGKITIVDPLVNVGTPVSATTIGDYTLNTAGAAGTFKINAGMTGTTVSIPSFTMSNIFEIGQEVSGNPNIPAGTTITNVTTGGAGFPPPITITLSNSVTTASPISTTQAGATTVSSTTVTLSATNANIAVGQEVTGTGIPANTTVVSIAGTTLILSQAATATGSGVTLNFGTYMNFSSMKNGGSNVVLEPSANNAKLALGGGVSGPGIQLGSKITSVVAATDINGLHRITLSLPVSGLATSPITTPQTLTFASVNVGATGATLTAANTAITQGQPVSGTGIKPGTFVAAISGTSITLSEPIQAGAPSPLVMNFYPDTAISSGAFIYSGPANYAAGLNHTLQIGDGISTQRGSIVTNGFNCIFQNLGGMISLGNLIVNAPDGDNRFMSTTNFGTNSNWGALNVQNQLTIAAGSTLKKVNGNCNYYVGGNIVNNGSFLQPSASSILYLGNFINGVVVPTALPQTISGTGLFSNNQYHLNATSPTGSISSLTVNNASAQGVTISVPQFRAIGGVTMTNGILHTSASYPMYVGIADVTSTSSSGVISGGSATSYIDGPVAHANQNSSTIGQYKLFPLGKNGKYLPILIASTGGVELMAEVFDTNTGAAGTGTSNLSTTRWKVSRVGTAGTFTGYNVRLGSNPNVTASNLIVHATADQGTYNLVSTPASASTFELAYFGTPNTPTIYLATPQTGGFLGNFAYAEGVACTGTPTPGLTIASSASVCSGQSVALSLTTPTTGSSVTYQWQSSVNSGSTWIDIPGATAATYVATPSMNTSYQCGVTCSAVTVYSTPIAITTTASTAIVTPASICTSGNANLLASGSTILNWYDAPTGGNLVATGTAYSPNVASTTTYYVSSGSESSGSINSSAYTGATTSSAIFKGISFDAINNLKLKTVTVYPKNTAVLTPITISLFNASGNIVPGTTPVTFIPTLATGTVGTTSQVISLNYTIPVGKDYRLVVTNGLVTTTNMLGNSTAVIAYPLTSGPLRLTGNVSDLNNAISATANTTNIFHNLTFDELCESVRVPVIATVVNTPAPIAAATQDACGTGTIADFIVTAQPTATLTWYDAATLGTTLPTSTTAVLNTTYYVSQTVNGCEGPRLPILAQGACLGTNDFEISGLRYYPNPVADQLTITAKETITKVEVYNLLGQKVKVLNTNTTTVQLNFNELPTSTYLVKAYSENKVQLFKIIKR
ncbi:T9SS type A sorting domain-containing protein [Flavobacterium sp.]|uniref:Ig-like domain-containing protein n=1 Tax=Flavobacterium sp. TaxID=239 RepID=UPI00263384A1|nr:T9SS type A sorting domain-containing protein [Flavobacterium sp.]